MSASSRSEIFEKIAKGRAQRGNSFEPDPSWRARLETPKADIIPAIAQTNGDAALQRFCQLASILSCSVETVHDPKLIPDQVATYLKNQQLAQEVWLGEDQTVQQLPWDKTPMLNIRKAEDDRDVDGGTVVTGIMGAVAETGTLVLTSDAHTRVGTAYMPDAHVIVVEEEQVVGGFDDIWDLLRERYGVGELPRAVNFISGPSRTADIEATMVLGAHGPRAVHIVLVSKDFVWEAPST